MELYNEDVPSHLGIVFFEPGRLRQCRKVLIRIVVGRVFFVLLDVRRIKTKPEEAEGETFSGRYAASGVKFRERFLLNLCIIHFK